MRRKWYWIKSARNSKVDQLHIAFRCDHDIAWFEVAQDNGRCARMNVAQCLADLHHPANNSFFIQWTFVIFKHLVQAAPRDKLHYKVVVTPFLKVQDHRGNTGVLEIKQQVNLFVEAFDGGFTFLRARIGRNEQFFYRTKVAGLPYLFNPINSAHTTLTKHLYNFKFSIKNSTERESHIVSLLLDIPRSYCSTRQEVYLLKL